jgi:hypothetical protein
MSFAVRQERKNNQQTNEPSEYDVRWHSSLYMLLPVHLWI